LGNNRSGGCRLVDGCIRGKAIGVGVCRKRSSNTHGAREQDYLETPLEFKPIMLDCRRCHRSHCSASYDKCLRTLREAHGSEA
jgi:hypothetical protein